MPFNNTTPESLESRTDSKDPDTTCRGLTSNGKPCKRSLAHETPSPVAKSHNGVLDASSLYCWQHKDQAEHTTINPAVAGDNGAMGSKPTQERTSLDSLTARLGIMSTTALPQRNSHSKLPPRKPGRQHSANGQHQSSEKPQSGRPKQPGFWASLCCLSNTDDDDHIEIVRHHQRLQFQRQEPASRPSLASRPPAAASTSDSAASAASGLLRPNASRPEPTDSAVSMPIRRPTGELSPQRLNMRATSTPDTRRLLSYIPGNLPPQTASTLLSELSKPISPHDEEGYIYIFWLTDTSNAAPSEDTAASLLSPPTTRQQDRRRRPSDVMTEFAKGSGGNGATKPKPKTIMLKIGRANNVHRRMNEWTRQCGYNLSLVRWYPYVHQSQQPQASPSPSPSSASKKKNNTPKVEKVHHVHRVERLIHLELANARVMNNCATCGKEHREWFEVEASETGVQAVDEVIRRWVRWAAETPNPPPII